MWHEGRWAGDVWQVVRTGVESPPTRCDHGCGRCVLALQELATAGDDSTARLWQRGGGDTEGAGVTFLASLAGVEGLGV